jgi:hypothetical protein
MSLRASPAGTKRERNPGAPDLFRTAQSSHSIQMSKLNDGYTSRGHQEGSSPSQRQSSPGNQQLGQPEQIYSPFSSSRNPHSTTGIDINTGLPYRRSHANLTHDHPTSPAASNIYDINYSQAAPSPETNNSGPDSKLVENTPYNRTSEQTKISRKDLGVWNVASLIINKQIGTGIFTTPGLVLSLTGSKTVSLALWIMGGFWAALRCAFSIPRGSISSCCSPLPCHSFPLDSHFND